MAEKELILKISFDTIKELEGQLKKVTAEFKQAAIGSEEFNKKANEIKSLNNELKAVQATTKEVTKETNNLDKAYKIAFGEVSASLGDMQRALRLLKNEGFEGKTQAEIAKLNSAVGTLKNNIQDSVALNKALDKGEYFNNMRAGLQGAVAAAQLLGSALKLMGVESEAAKKLEAATLQLMSATQALQVIRDLKDKGTVKALVLQTKEMALNVLHTAQTWAATAATNAQAAAEANKAVLMGKASIVTKAITALQWLWNAAMAANPIGLLIAGIAALAVGVAALAGAFNKANKESKSTIEINKRLAESMVEPLSKFDLVTLKLKNAKQGTDEYKKAVDEFNKIQKENNGVMLSYNATQSEANKLINESRTALIKKLEVQAQESVLLSMISEKTKALFEIDQLRKKGDDFSLQKIKVIEAGIKEVDKEISAVTGKLFGFKEDLGKNPFIKEEEVKTFSIIDGTTRNITENVNKLLEANQKENEQLETTKQLDKDIQEINNLSRQDLENIVESERERNINLAQLNELKLEAPGELPLEEELLIIETQISEKQRLEQEKTASVREQTLIRDGIEADATKRRLASDELETERFKQMQSDRTAATQGALGGAVEALKLYSELSAGNAKKQKDISIAIATITAIQSAITAYNSAAAVPIIGVVLGPIMAAVALAAGLVNVQKIKNTPINAAAGGGIFRTKGPTNLVVGDNPGGVEEITVTPISGKGKTTVAPGGGLIAMAGGGTVTTNTTQPTGGSILSDLKTAVIQGMKEAPAPIVDHQEFTTYTQKSVRIKERANL